MFRYLKFSLVLHGTALALLLLWTFLAPMRAQNRIKFVILPKGTSLNAALTKEVEEAMKSPDQPPGNGGAPKPAATTPSPTPAATDTPVPTPIKLATPTPLITPAPTAVPEKTIAVAPKGTPKPAASPTPTATPKKTATPKPSGTPRKSPTPNVKITPNAKNAKQQAKATPAKKKPTPKPTPPIASAYDIKGDGGNKLSGVDLPKQTPANVKVGEAAPGQEIGVPGVPEGVEGAPLPLDRNQSMLSMLYTTRARMKIQANFTVPPGVNDPNLTCIVEWEVLPDGNIRNARVSKSTGVAQYDACALDSLAKTANLGPLPPEFGTRSIWTSLTFVFAGDENGGLRADAPSAPPANTR